METSLLGAGLLIFALVFAVELVDRTNIAVILMAARHPLRQVWLGAAIGFAAITAVSVLLGVVFVVFLLPYLFWIKIGAGVALVAAGVHEVVERDHPGGPTDPGAGKRSEPKRPLAVVGTAASLILVLEIGDETQILTIGFVVATSQPILVYVAVTLALLTTSGLGARLGHFLRNRVRAERLRRAAGAVFIVVGLGVILFAVFPSLVPPLFG